MAAQVSFLLKSNRNNEIKELTDQIDLQGNKLDLLLQNLLKWSAEESENKGNNEQATNIAQCIEDLKEIYSSLINTKNIQLHIDINFKDNILVDPNYLMTILRNLFDNAIKYGELDNPINISLSSTNKNVIFYIQNKAQLSDEQFIIIQNIFSTSIKYDVGENGLGLGLIKDFANKINATIEVKYKNELITFTLSIPIKNLS